MTEIATRHDNAVALVAPTPPEAIHAAIEQWVGGLAASVQGAEYIVDTPLCPDSLWPLPPGTQLSKIPGKNPKVPLPGEDRESFLARRRVAAYSLGGIVRYGLQLGIPPEVATQGLFPIGGRISMYADQMVALIKSKGHKHRIITRTREKCTIEVQRLGEAPQEFTYTIEDAIQNGYVPGKGPNEGQKWPDGKPKLGGNEKYLTDPAGMLEARCNSTGLTAVFPDVLRGLISVEAMRDEQRVTVTAIDLEPESPAPARTSAAAILARASSAAAEPQVSEPPAEASPASQASAPAAPAEPEVQRYVLPVSKAKLDLIKAAFEKHGYGAPRSPAVREQRMRVLSALVERPIDDPRELTADEGQIVIDHIGPRSGLGVIERILGVEGALEDAADAGEVADAAGEDYDPTAEASWVRDEAAAGQ